MYHTQVLQLLAEAAVDAFRINHRQVRTCRKRKGSHLIRLEGVLSLNAAGHFIRRRLQRQLLAEEEQEHPGKRGEDEVEEGVQIDETDQSRDREIKNVHVFSFLQKR